MSAELPEHTKALLQRWINSNENVKFNLLYKASNDGCSSSKFHQKCNGKGPTVTLVHNIDNTIYGGYTSTSWHSNGSWSYDDKAFLFRLVHNGTSSPMKFPTCQPEKAVYGHKAFGPCFGGAYNLVWKKFDMCTFKGNARRVNDYFQLNGDMSFGVSYDMQGEDFSSVANSHMRVMDIEVFGIEVQQRLESPWRTNIQRNKWVADYLNELKDSIENYKPLEGLPIPQSRILLIGQVGAGKSSYFNTINSIFRGHVSSQANSGSSGKSMTTMYRMHQVRSSVSGRPLHFRLCDTRGLEVQNGLDAHEIGYMLDGHVPDRHQFNPSLPLYPEVAGFIKSPTLGEKIHCVVFVIDGSTFDITHNAVLSRIKDLQTRMNQRGVPQVVLLTKIDKLCGIVSNDIRDVFSSATIRDSVDKVAYVMGLPRSHVFPVKNYESEMQLDDCVDILALHTLQQILNFSDDYLYNYLDQVEKDIPENYHGDEKRKQNVQRRRGKPADEDGQQWTHHGNKRADAQA